MVMGSRTVQICALALIVSAYLTVVWMGSTEETRRSLAITGPPPSGKDYVTLNVRITSIDTAQGLVHGRIRVVPRGRFAEDGATPAVDLKLLINAVQGEQAVAFPARERIHSIEFTSVLSGNQNKYPFDRYTSNLDLLVVASTPKSAPIPTDISPDDQDPLSSQLVVGNNDLEHSETVPIKENFSASIPGLKFAGTVKPVGSYRLMESSVVIGRAYNVIVVSVAVMIVMFLLSITIMMVVLQTAAAPESINLLPLSLCIALIFGLPALRNAQPGVPAVGAMGDYLSFIWAEFIVSASAIALGSIWIVRSVREQRQIQAVVNVRGK
jgi:hypothetical protein